MKTSLRIRILKQHSIIILFPKIPEIKNIIPKITPRIGETFSVIKTADISESPRVVNYIAMYKGLIIFI